MPAGQSDTNHFQGFFYGFHVKLFSEMSQNQTCRETLGDSFNDGIRKIKTYPLQPAEKYLEILKPTSHPELLFKENDKNTVELPVILSAASSDHLYEVESMFLNLNTVVRKAYPTIKVVFYDLGLSKWEKIKVIYMYFLGKKE